MEGCQKTGSLKETSIKHCMVPTDGQPVDKSWYTHEPLYLQWKDWNCKSECRYHCMMEREGERAKLGLQPVKYHGKWPLKRASVFQVARCRFELELSDFCVSFSLPYVINFKCLCAFILRSLYLQLSPLLLSLCNLMGGYRSSSCFIISFLYGQKLTRHTTNTLACGTSMGSLP